MQNKNIEDFLFSIAEVPPVLYKARFSPETAKQIAGDVACDERLLQVNVG